MPQLPQFEDLPFNERPDLTPYLVHLTKRGDGRTAFENLVKILKEGKLNGSSGSGFIRGPNRAACFMDIPFAALKYLLNEDNCKSDPPKYEPYGIFITKMTAARKNIRPVLYLSNEEVNDLQIPDEEKWRVVRFEPNEDGWISWMHEREWRCKGNLDLPDQLGVLVHRTKDATKLNELLADPEEKFEVRPRTILPLVVVCQGLIYM